MSSKKSNKNIEFLPKDEFHEPDKIFTVVTIGDCGVGKTALIERITKNKFAEEYYATIGAAYNNLYLKINDKILKLEIFDTSGSEKYESFSKYHWKKASIAILVYDITKRASFENIDLWLEKLKSNSTVILVGNK